MARRFDRLSVRAELLEGGEIAYASPRFVKGMLQQYDPCPITVVFERKKHSRSREQLGYLWGVVYPLIAEHTGHSTEDLHEVFKAKYLHHRVIWRGADMLLPGSTSVLTANEMAEFITNVIQEANELEIEIPPPDPLYQFRD